MLPKEFAKIPAVVEALKNPRNPQSILNYFCGCNLKDSKAKNALHIDENVEPLLSIWFRSGTALDRICRPFSPVIRELKADPATLIEDHWVTIEGQAAKALQSKSCQQRSGTLEWTTNSTKEWTTNSGTISGDWGYDNFYGDDL